jgi:hypothetical protein
VGDLVGDQRVAFDGPRPQRGSPEHHVGAEGEGVSVGALGEGGSGGAVVDAQGRDPERVSDLGHPAGRRDAGAQPRGQLLGLPGQRCARGQRGLLAVGGRLGRWARGLGVGLG